MMRILSAFGDAYTLFQQGRTSWKTDASGYWMFIDSMTVVSCSLCMVCSLRWRPDLTFGMLLRPMSIIVSAQCHGAVTSCDHEIKFGDRQERLCAGYLLWNKMVY